MTSTETGFIDPARSTPCAQTCRLDRRPEDTPVDKVSNAIMLDIDEALRLHLGL
jgi:hypothetical protein